MGDLIFANFYFLLYIWENWTALLRYAIKREFMTHELIFNA